MTKDKELERIIARGNKCVLWGTKVEDMTRDELIGFIGFLAELIEYERVQ